VTDKLQLSILGGRPQFAQKVPIAKPVLPSTADLAEGLARILETGIVTNGPFTRAFEESVAEHLKVKHALAVSSCTTGLMIAYRALDLEGEVIVPSFTFMATVSSLVWAGLRPVFADINYETGNLDPAAAAAAITPRTSAIVAVHNSGNPADIVELQDLAERNNLALIFDAAQGFGSLHKGEAVGGQGEAQVFSLTPTKLVVAGEGGVIATNDDQIAARVRILREYGNPGDYNTRVAGVNGRMPEFSALMGTCSLLKLADAVSRRNLLAMLYRERLGKVPGISFQLVRDGNRSSYKDFSIIVSEDAFGLTRDELATVLQAENIDTRNYYDPPVHRQIAYRKYAFANAKLENTDRLSARIISLPIWSHMDDGVVSGICETIEKAHELSSHTSERLRVSVGQQSTGV
jgi:dTDP-4-amino-4,6-dideoxygalactose transaminase